MNIQITCRHVGITEAIKGYVEQKVGAVVEDMPKLESVHVILDIQKINQIAEVVICGKKRLRVEAAAQSEDMYKSIDMLADRAERQLRKFRKKITDHKPPRKRQRLADVERQITGTALQQPGENGE